MTKLNSPSSNPSSADQQSSSNRRIRNPARELIALWIGALATILSVAVHGYLASKHYDLRFGEVTTKSLCNINATFNCEAASASKFSELLGVPMAIWGALTNAVLLILILLRPLSDPEKRAGGRRNLLLLSGLIALTSIVMGGISAFALGTFCPFCMAAYVLSFITLASLWVGLAGDRIPVATSALNQNGPRAGDFVPLFVAGVVVLIGGFITNDKIAKSYNSEDMGRFARDQVQEWTHNPPRKIETLDSLVAGPDRDKARMTIVEFADFRCGHCRHAAPVLKAFVSSHRDVRLEFQAWPLDGECNTSIPTVNGASCLLAGAVYCAQKIKNRGWDAHEYVYEHQELYSSVEAVKANLADLASSIGVTPQEMETCTSSQDTKAMIAKQAAVGSALNLRGTPTVFVNGKELPAGQSMVVLTEAYRQLSQ